MEKRKRSRLPDELIITPIVTTERKEKEKRRKENIDKITALILFFGIIFLFLVIISHYN